MHIESENLIIRTLKETDAEEFIDMASDGSLQEIFGKEEEYSWLSGWIGEAIDLTKEDDPWKEYLAYAIVRKEDGRVIGSVGSSVYKDLHEVGITYFIGSAYRGYGYAAEAATVYSTYFMKQYPSITQLIATVRVENIASWKTVEKIGYKRMGMKKYQDVNDEEPNEYFFYTYRR
ncbi:GNAT family N-acetyltransferase [Anaerosporobacter faecicola]|uniref:GNAT family N-acetyltransferase n=1 Tax=Anaerosporobacter faecicola TaxID=2718714 RepID=UPI00143B1603|nr:GNAT family N-acetyltransferase [Anaerosporobacter faecicola]